MRAQHFQPMGSICSLNRVCALAGNRGNGNKDLQDGFSSHTGLRGTFLTLSVRPRHCLSEATDILRKIFPTGEPFGLGVLIGARVDHGRRYLPCSALSLFLFAFICAAGQGTNPPPVLVGKPSPPYGWNSISIGPGALAPHSNSIAIGADALTTRDHQLVITFENGTEMTVNLPTNTTIRGLTNL